MYIKLIMIIHASHKTIIQNKKYANEILSYLKIVSKRPVPQHFKECVMVNILSNIIQIIMFATSSNTFLGVNSSYPFGHITTGVNSTQENGLKLHQKIRKLTSASEIQTRFSYTHTHTNPPPPHQKKTTTTIKFFHWNFNTVHLFIKLHHILIQSWYNF